MKELRVLAEELGVHLNESQLQQFVNYYKMLIEKNRVMNLTAITEKEEVLVKHFADSLSIGNFVQFDRQYENVSRETWKIQRKTQDKRAQIKNETENKIQNKIENQPEKKLSENKAKGTIKNNSKNKLILPEQCKILDLGTGAGFPGIPLKIAYPDLSIVLADSLNKRILFLKEVVEMLGISGVEVIHGRAEELARQQKYRETFDLCVSRAVAKISVLAEYCLPFVKVGGFFVAYKASGCEEELEEGKKAISVLGGKVKVIEKLMLPKSDIGRVLIFIEKVKPTGKKYPRTAGKPTASPISS